MDNPLTHKRARFIILSQKRQAQAEEVLRLIGNLSRHNYDWEPNEVRAMFGDLRLALNEAEHHFHRSSRWPTKEKTL